jgi:hypothetical protein
LGPIDRARDVSTMYYATLIRSHSVVLKGTLREKRAQKRLDLEQEGFDGGWHRRVLPQETRCDGTDS